MVHTRNDYVNLLASRGSLRRGFLLSVCIVLLSSYLADWHQVESAPARHNDPNGSLNHILEPGHHQHNHQHQQQSFVEQQLSAADHVQLALAAGSQGQPVQMNQISAATAQSPSSSQQAPDSSSLVTRSRSPRSIGEMFKKLFSSGNKRSKQSGSQSQSAREWEQQQLQQHQQQQQQHQHQHQLHQQNQAAMALAAANQHAVYANPFAYSGQPASAGAFYPQFNPYPNTGLVAWPAATNHAIAQALRGTPTLIASPSPAVALASSGPLYTSASQSYNSYAAPPPQSSSNSNPTAAASHTHTSAVPASSGHGSSSIDFHQVLDALVRTSGFAPAGDQEAAVATYGSDKGTPVFSFKKLISMPFYLSTEEKPLDGLANSAAPGGSSGYSIHSMPIMRRHVRRMSSPASQQQQQAYGLGQQIIDSNHRTERLQQQYYSNYLNAINNQLANSQLAHYLNQPDLYTADLALASMSAAQPLAPRSSPSSSGSGSIGANMATAASMIIPMTVQAPQSLSNQQAHNSRQQQYDQQELQSLLSGIQQLSNANTNNDLYSPFASTASLDGHRFGSQQQQLHQAQQPQFQQQQQQQHYWYNGSNKFSDLSSPAAINSNGNANNGQDYISGSQQTPSGSDMISAQDNVAQQQRSSGPLQSSFISSSSPSSSDGQAQQQQASVHQSTPNTQQPQQTNLATGQQQHNVSNNSANGFAPSSSSSSSQIEGQ